jgi:hypothetical protein
MFILFFGMNIAGFGAQQLLVFLLSISVAYSVLRMVFATIPTLNPRAQEFISLAVLFVIARTTASGQASFILGIGMALINIMFPQCADLSTSALYQMGFVVVGIVMILFSAVGLSGPIRLLLFGFGLFWALLPSSMSVFLGISMQSIQFCVYYWVLQMAMVLFLFNWIFQASAMDWMGGVVMGVTGGKLIDKDQDYDS